MGTPGEVQPSPSGKDTQQDSFAADIPTSSHRSSSASRRAALTARLLQQHDAQHVPAAPADPRRGSLGISEFSPTEASDASSLSLTIPMVGNSSHRSHSHRSVLEPSLHGLRAKPRHEQLTASPPAWPLPKQPAEVLPASAPPSAFSSSSNEPSQQPMRDFQQPASASTSASSTPNNTGRHRLVTPRYLMPGVAGALGPYGGPLGATLNVPQSSQLLTCSSSDSRASSSSSLNNAGLLRPNYAAPMPMDEVGRQATVGCFVDSVNWEKEADPALQALCELVTRLLKVPLAGVSILDGDRHRFCALAGKPRFDCSRNLSFCGWTLLAKDPEILVIPDLLSDARMCTHPLVVDPGPGEQGLRFYAGCPLVASNGFRLGSLCCLDVEPRQLAAADCCVLTNIAELVVRQLEKDHMLHLKRQENRSLLRTLDCFTEGMLIVDASTPAWQVLHANEAWSACTEHPSMDLTAGPFWGAFTSVAESKEQACARLNKAVKLQTSFTLRVEQRGQPIMLRFIPAGNQQLSNLTPRGKAAVGVPSSIPDTFTVPGAPASARLFFAIVVPEGISEWGSQIMDTRRSMDSTVSILPAGNPPLSFSDVSLGVLIRVVPGGLLYRGTWNGEAVSVKVMERPSKDAGPAEQAVLACTLTHPNLVRGYRHATRPQPGRSAGVGQALAETWLVQEPCDLGTLADALQTGRLNKPRSVQADPDAVMACALEIASALHCLHSNGHVHGNISADCAWLVHASNTRGFVVKLSEMGLPVASTQQLPITAVSHAAPELLSQGAFSEAGDVYALGVVMWEMSHQRRAWGGKRLDHVVRAVVRRHRTPKFQTHLPEHLTGLAMLCMAADPEQRPTAKAIVRALGRLANPNEFQGGTLDNGKSSQRRPRSWKRVPSFKRLSWRRARDESARDERSSPTEAASGSEAPRHGSAASSRPDWTIGTAKSRKSEQQQRDAQENAENQPQAASSGAQGPAADPAPFRIPEETSREHAASPREQMSSPREHAGSPRKSTTSPRPPRGSPQGRAVHGTPQGKAPHSRRSHQSTPQSSRSEGAVSTGHKRVVQAAAEEDGKAHPQGWLLCC